MCYALRSHMSAAPPRVGLTQALGHTDPSGWIMLPEDILRILAWPVLGALAGAMSTFLYNLHLARVKSTIELHSEFHSDSFLKSRIKADDLLKKHLIKGKRYRLPDIHEICSATPKTGPEDWAHISRVLHFFEKLHAMNQAKMIDAKTLSILLGSYIDYYHSSYFRHISQEAGEWNNLAESLRGLKGVA